MHVQDVVTSLWPAGTLGDEVAGKLPGNIRLGGSRWSDQHGLLLCKKSLFQFFEKGQW